MGVETALLISAGTQAAGSLVSGYYQNQAINNQIAQYEENKKYAELAAIQQENVRMERMNNTLSNNRVLAGAAGILDDSRSFEAIQQDVLDQAEKDVANIRLNADQINSQIDRQVVNSKIDKQSVTFGSIFNASAYALNGWSYYKYYTDPGPSRFNRLENKLELFNRKYRGN